MLTSGSEPSYGFRPGRPAHQAVAQAQAYMAQGYGYVVDIGLEKFFDRVNHDILMGPAANLMLEVLDKELERRGRRLARYADDGNIYVRSERAGQRVMAGVSRFLEQKLKLKVNQGKSAVARPGERKFLGFIANAKSIFR